MSEMAEPSPAELCEAIMSVGAVQHAGAETRFKSSGVEREVNVWVDGDAPEPVLDGVVGWIDAAGYEVTRHEDTGTGNIWFEGQA